MCKKTIDILSVVFFYQPSSINWCDKGIEEGILTETMENNWYWVLLEMIQWSLEKRKE